MAKVLRIFQAGAEPLKLVPVVGEETVYARCVPRMQARNRRLQLVDVRRSIQSIAVPKKHPVMRVEAGHGDFLPKVPADSREDLLQNTRI